MEEEMEDSIKYTTFTVVEVDLDYEFDAARYFDFYREETAAEAREAELWFQSAPNYPPSPFVTRMLLGGSNIPESVSASPKPKDVDIKTSAEIDSDIKVETESYVMDENCRGAENSTNIWSASLQKSGNQPQLLSTGLTFYNPLRKDDLKAETKAILKPSIPRTSTLMKPTASQLAKQNQPCPGGHPRFQKSSVYNNDTSSNNSCATELQAAKRQKLEEGHLRKVTDTKQQTFLVHKPPKKDGTMEGNSMQAKLRVTIPREPALETAYRAQRMRPNTTQEVKHVTSAIPKFRARPLNRKILQGPSLLLPKRSTPRLTEFQEFHLRTSERAMQHSSAVSSSSTNCHNSDKALQKQCAGSIFGCIDTRVNYVAARERQECESTYNFRARPLNKKEFNFSTQKRVQHDLPIEFLNKLSLTSEHPLDTESQLKLLRPTCVPHKMKHLAKGKQPWHELQFQCRTDGGISEVGSLSCMPRSFGIH